MDPLHSIEAEQSLLGALLLNNNLLENILDYLRAEHFSDAAHGKIFAAITYFSDRGKIADPITLKDYFANEETLESVGGANYLIDLVSSSISTTGINDYARLIYDFYLRRELVGIGHNIITQANTHKIEEEAITQIEGAEKQLYDLATKGKSNTGPITFLEALDQTIAITEAAFKKEGHIVGVETGFIDLDKWLGGLHPSDLIILAGRPSMGKTALATNIAFQAAMSNLKNPKSGASVAFFSLEMSAEQLASRILSSETKISSDKMRRGEIRSSDFQIFLKVSDQIKKAPLFIDDTPALSVMALRHRARRIQRQHGLGLIIVDYLQLLESGSKKGHENRVQEISDITRALKAIAKELSVPVVALSQLSRAVEQREDKRPQLADLRESGSIEQDADVVMFVFREQYYEERKQPTPDTDKHREWQKRMEELNNKAEVIIAKQRHGPIGTIKLFFDGRFTKFGNLAQDVSRQ